MRVNFTNNEPNEINKQILMSPASEIPVWEETKEFGLNSREFTWEIKKPRLGYTYRLTW
jgi:hypothetical protein